MSNSKTPLGLNQWELDEKLKMADFNADNEIIDTKLRELDDDIDAVDTKVVATNQQLRQDMASLSGQLTGEMNGLTSSLTGQMQTLNGQLTGRMDGIDTRVDDMSNHLTYTANASYQSGVFVLTGLPSVLPATYGVRFIAPADYTFGDKLQIGSAVFNVSTQIGGAPQTDAFKAGVVVSMDIHGAGGRAFFKTGGGSSTYGILPSQTKISVAAKDASATATLTITNTAALAGTKLVCKAGSMPASDTDGIVFDTGKATSYNMTGLQNNVSYVARAFAYNADGEVQTDINGATATFKPEAIPTEFTYLTGFTVNPNNSTNYYGSWTVPATRWYKIFVWGSCGGGASGGSGSGGWGGQGGSGGAAGGFAASMLRLTAGTVIPVRIDVATTTFGTYLSATGGTDASTGNTPKGGSGTGGNIANLTGATGGFGGGASGSGAQGGNNGGSGGTGYNNNGGGGGGGARWPGSDYCKYIAENASAALKGGNGRGGAAATTPAIALGPNVLLYGAGGGGGGGASSGTTSGGKRGNGQYGVVIIEQAAF